MLITTNIFKKSTLLFIATVTLLSFISIYKTVSVRAVPCGTDPTCLANSEACTSRGGTYNPDTGTCNTAVATNATCYMSTGSNTVESSSYECYTDTTGRKTYKDASGNTITNPVSGKCYLGVRAGRDSFITITFTESDCATLEQKRLEAERLADQNPPANTPGNSAPGDGIVVDGAGDSIFGLLQSVVNALFAVIAFIVIGVIIVAGIQYSTAGGNPQAAGDAKKKINSAITALILLAFLYPFIQWLVPGGIFSN